MEAVNILFSFQSTSTGSKRCKRKRGPEKKRLKVKIYHLPDGEPIPKFSKVDPLIEAHMSHSYGMFISKYRKTYKTNYKFINFSNLCCAVLTILYYFNYIHIRTYFADFLFS